MKKIIILLMTFLIFSTSLNNNALAEDSIYLKKDAPAPFSGFLLPEEKIKELKDAAIERDGYKAINTSLNRSIDLYKQNDTINAETTKLLLQRNDDLSKSLKDNKDVSDFTKVLWFGLGIIASGIAVYGAKATLK